MRQATVKDLQAEAASMALELRFAHREIARLEALVADLEEGHDDEPPRPKDGGPIRIPDSPDDNGRAVY